MSENVQYLNDTNFNNTIAKGVTLVDFFAEWCPPCKRIAPLIDQLGTEMHGKAVIAKVDVEQAPQTAEQFQITSIPTIIVFKDGIEVKRVMGLQDKKALEHMISTAM